MRKSRSHLNNLGSYGNRQASGGFHPQNPIGSSKQTEEIQRRLNAIGVKTHQMQDEMHQAEYSGRSAGRHYALQEDHVQADRVTSEIDLIHQSLEQVSRKLNQFAGNADGTASHAQALVRQNEQITAELLEMRKLLNTLGSGSDDELIAEIADIRHALQNNHDAVSRQLASGGTGHVDTGAFAMAVEASHEKISAVLNAMQEDMIRAADRSDSLNRALETRHNEVSDQINQLQETVNSAMGNPELYAQTVENSHRALLAHFDELKQSVAMAQLSGGDDGTPDLTKIEMRLEEITRAVVALSADSPATDNLDRIEARIGDLAKNVSSIQSSGDNETLGRIESDISELVQRMPQAGHAGNDGSAFEQHMKEIRSELASLNENMAARGVSHSTTGEDAGVLAGLSEQIAGLSELFDTRMEKLERESSASSFIGENIEQSALMNRFDELANDIKHLKSEPFDPSGLGPIAGGQSASDYSEAFAALGKQLEEIREKMGNIDEGAGGSLALDPLSDRLAGIEQQLAAGRDIAIEVASQAAQEAVERAVREMPGSSGAAEFGQGAIQNLSDDIRRWRQSVTDKNSDSLEVFDSVRETLAVMADRLQHIEEGMKSGKSYQFGPTGETGTPVDFAARENSANTAEAKQKVKPEAILESVFTKANAEAEQNSQETEFSAEAVMLGADAGSGRKDQLKETRNIGLADPLENEYSVDAQHHDSETRSEAPETGENPLFAAAVAEANSRNAREENPITDMEEADNEANSTNSDLNEMSEDIKGEQNDAPLEPGSGEPDLATLVRQANEKRRSNAKNGTASSSSEFLASARRAAQAAAQEAGVLQEEIEQKTSRGLFSNLPELLKKRKKVLIMGAAAVLMIAIAIPLASVFMGSKESVFSDNKAQPVIEESVEQPGDASALPGLENSSYELTPPDSITSNPENDIVNSITADKPQVEVVTENEPLIVPVDDDELLNTTGKNDADQTAEKVDVSMLGFVNEPLRVAAASGDPVALFEIGKRYGEGTGTEKNLGEAAKWYKRSAEYGFAPAQYIIGNFNEKGIGVGKDLSKAVTWYELASAEGNIIAMHNLGVLYATPGIVTDEPDMEKAFASFSQAAEFGVRDSQVNLGIFYTKGFGTDVDLIEAYKWFAIASAGGDADAATKLEAIRAALRPDQLEAAKKIAENWTPSTPTQTANKVTIPDEWKPQAKPATVATVNKKTISQVQSVLTRLGYNTGSADGIIGNKTRIAIKAYREKAGLAPGQQIDAELLRSLTSAISS